MKPLGASTLAVACLGAMLAASPQQPPPPSPFPWRMADYTFHESLAAAINAAKGEEKIVVLTVQTVAARNRVQWLMQQQALWTHPLTRASLSGRPIVAVQKTSATGKSLPLPTFGIAILTPDGRRVINTIDFSRIKVDTVPGLLAEMLCPELRQPEEPGPEAAREMQRFRSQRARILNLIDNGKLDGAREILAEELSRSPDGFGPRLLEFSYRQRAIGRDYHFQLRDRQRPVADALCVVDDDAGFLRALAGWQHGPIYPILFRDDHYLPLFLEAFKPAAVYLVAAPAAATARPLDQTRLLSAYATAFGSKSMITTTTAAVAMWRKAADRSPGLVLTHPTSKMWAAGLALAAGRRQLLAMQTPVANPLPRVSHQKVWELRQRLRRWIIEQRIDGLHLFDELDFITLATELPYRYANQLAADKSTYATDDAIARDRFDLPFAMVGRLLGERQQALYMAMCGLFLTQDKTLLFSRYGKAGSWDYFSSDRAAAVITGHGLLTHINHPQATLARWQQMFRNQRNEHNLVHVNSSGGPRNWSTSKGNGSYDDLPLTVPAIVSYVHSNSLGNGYDANTIGGRWLHNGAYSFFGSTAEPYLDAFVSAFDAYDRAIKRAWPIGAAHRLLPLQQRWRSWKLMLFGDPLVRLRFAPVERQAYQAGAISGPVTVLARAADTNPFRLSGLELRLFHLQCQAWQGDWKAVAKGLPGLVRTAAASPTRPTAALRQRMANLVAWSVYRPSGLERLHALGEPLLQARIHSQHLSHVTHTLSVAELHRLTGPLATRGSGAELRQLLLHHLQAPFAKPMYQRIGELYKPVFDQHPDGKRLRRAVKQELTTRAKTNQELRAFLRAF